MTSQYLPETINPEGKSGWAQGRGANGYGSTDTAVLRWDATTSSGANDFTLTDTAAAGLVVTCLKPGTYIVMLTSSEAAGGYAIGISLGGTNAPFNTTPAAFGGDDGIIALADNVTADASAITCSVSFYLEPAAIDGTQNLVRFMAEVGGSPVDAHTAFRIDRVSSAF